MVEDLDIWQRNDCHCDLIGMKVIIIKIRWGMKTIVLNTMGVFQIQMSLFRNAQRKLDWDWEHPSHSSRQDGEDSVPQVRDGESSTKEQFEYFGFQWEQNKTIVDIMGHGMWENESNQGPGGRGGRFGHLHCTGQNNAAHDAVEESEDKVPAVGVLNLKLNIMMPY